MTAPLQVIALSFSRGAGAEDRILAEVDRLRGRGVLRLLDMLFVGKSQDGTIERLTIGDDEDFGTLLAAVVPVANGGRAVPAPADDPAAFGHEEHVEQTKNSPAAQTIDLGQDPVLRTGAAAEAQRDHLQRCGHHGPPCPGS